MPERKPTRTADLDYFYGQSSELFSFYRIPKLLFQDSRFQPLSTDAKTLYGILLDRMSLSARNGWLDKAGRVFIIYTVQEVQDSLGCADKKATKLLRELEEYGLIERKRRGLGKPDLIYVKNFSSESSKTPYLNRYNDDSGTVQNTLQDPAKLRCNKTERNNTEVSDTDPIYSDENDWMSKRAQLEEYFSQSLEVDLLLRLCPDDEDHEFIRLGPELYIESLDILLNAWNGEPDSMSSANLLGICRFVELYHSEYNKGRLIAKLRQVDAFTIFRLARTAGVSLPGKTKYLQQVYTIYNGGSRRAALPLKF